MTLKEVVGVAVLIALSPLALYLREQAYRAPRGQMTIGQDLSELWESFQRWRRDRAARKELKEKYKHLNKKRNDSN